MRQPLTDRLICVGCDATLKSDDDSLLYCQGKCQAKYDIVNGIPNLLLQPIEAGEHELETDFKPHRRPTGSLTELTRHHRLWNEVLQQTRMLRDSLERDLDVLDIGCGTKLLQSTEYKQLLEAHGGTYYGIDPSQFVLERMQDLDPSFFRAVDALFVRAAGERLPLPSSSVDVAFTFSALDHCAQPGTVIDEVRRVLRPNGTLLVDLGNRDSWHRRTLRRMAPSYAYSREIHDHHTFKMSPYDLTSLLSEHGFDPVQVFTYGHLSLLARGRRIEDVAHFTLAKLLGQTRSRAWWQQLDQRLSHAHPDAGSKFLCIARPRHAFSQDDQ